MAMLLACGSVLSYAAAKGFAGADRARARSTRACWRRPPPATKTLDLGGHATTSEFTDDVINRVRTKIEVWSSLAR